MAGNAAGQVIGKGNSSEVHACQSDPHYVIRTVRQQDEVEWQRELSRLRRVPALSVTTTIFATSGRRSLLSRLWPVPRGALRTMEVIRLKYDISAALEMLHRAHIVHADIHADNVMLRSDPACFVLIDYAGCTGDSVYPLHLGYGASGYGGVTHRPPTLESPPEPIRTAHGDYYRLACTILKQLYIGPEPSKRKYSDKLLPALTFGQGAPHMAGTRHPGLVHPAPRLRSLRDPANLQEAGIKLLLPPLMDITDNPFTLCPTENMATCCLHSKWAPFGVFGQLLDGLPSMQDSRHSSPSIDQPSDYKSIFFGAYSQGPLVGLRAQTRRYPMVSRLLNAVIYTLCGGGGGRTATPRCFWLGTARWDCTRTLTTTKRCRTS